MQYAIGRVNTNSILYHERSRIYCSACMSNITSSKSKLNLGDIQIYN